MTNIVEENTAVYQ